VDVEHPALIGSRYPPINPQIVGLEVHATAAATSSTDYDVLTVSLQY
jgi:hypothetical protein